MRTIFGTLLLVSSLFVVQSANADTPNPGKGPTDPQIVAILVTANQVDIDAAKVAKMQSKNKDVKEFADTMVRDHESANKQAKDLAAKLKIKPEENPTSKSLKEGGKENLA